MVYLEPLSQLNMLFQISMVLVHNGLVETQKKKGKNYEMNIYIKQLIIILIVD